MSITAVDVLRQIGQDPVDLVAHLLRGDVEFFSEQELMKTWDTPSVETERSSSMPLMVLTASSILSVISVSTSSGAAPEPRGHGDDRELHLGKRSTPSLK